MLPQKTPLPGRFSRAYHRFTNPPRSSKFVGNEKCRFYIIETRFELSMLRQEILEDPEYFQVVYTTSGQDTFRHLVLLSREMANQLISEKWPYMKIRQYQVDTERDLPGLGDHHELFIKLPFDKGREFYVSELNRRLRMYTRYAVLPDNCWILDIPTCRDGDMVGHCIISFSSNVSLIERAYVRLLLIYDSWHHNDERMSCQWRRGRQPHSTPVPGEIIDTLPTIVREDDSPSTPPTNFVCHRFRRDSIPGSSVTSSLSSRSTSDHRTAA